MGHTDEPEAVGAASPAAGVNRPGRIGSAAVLALAVVLATAAALLYIGMVEPRPLVESAVRTPWWLLAAGFLAAEVVVVHFHFRQEAHSFSMSELPLVFGLFFAAPAELIGAHLLGAGAALVLHRRQRGIKLALNLGHFALGTTVAVVIFQTIVSDRAAGGPRSWVAALLATIVASAIGVAAIFAAISIFERRLQPRKLREETWLALVASVASAALALVGVNAVLHHPAAAWLLLIPTGMFLVTYRAYVVQHQRHRDLRLLYESFRLLYEAPDLNTGITRLLTNARDTLRAEVAEVLLHEARPGSSGLSTSVRGPDGHVTIGLDPTDGDDRLLRIATSRGAHVLDARRTASDDHVDLLARRGLRDAVIAPLVGEHAVLGAFIIGNRLGEGTPFNNHDLVVVETLANQLAAVLEKGHLQESLAEASASQEQLRQQVLHDTLTGLGNRQLFNECLEQALASRRATEASVAVLVVDLDDFKAVNDSYGHATGDDLLIQAAERLRSCLRPTDVAARLGGDEFALLLTGVTSDDEAVTVARRVITSLARDFLVYGHRTRINASVGIAVRRADEHNADELQQRADAAMYRAKNAGKGRYALDETATGH